MNTYQFQRTLYATGGIGEHLDCSVRAYAVAACISYAEAHRQFTKKGRTPCKATHIGITWQVLQEHVPGAKWMKMKPMTLGRFLKTKPRGHWILATSNHMFAVIDGEVHDWSLRSRCRVQNFFRLCQ